MADPSLSRPTQQPRAVHEPLPSLDSLVQENKQLRATKEKLVQHNMKLLLLLKEKDKKLYQAELVIRKYRSRLIRWFEDMQMDPLASAEDAQTEAEEMAALPVGGSAQHK